MGIQFHSLCIPVKGFFRTAIYDLQFGNFYVTNNQVWDNLIKRGDGAKIKELSFAKNIFMATADQRIYPMTKPEFDYPSSITNAIIEIDSAMDFGKLAEVLQEAFCYNIQIVACNPGLNAAYIKNMTRIIHQSIFRHCELVISYEDYNQVKDLLKRSEFPELSFLCVYNSPANELKYANKEYPSILFSVDPFSYAIGKDAKSLDLFRINPVLYAESLKFNTYYNRKIFIDRNGMIKNGPLANEVYGNIYTNHSWKELLKNAEFKKLWKIKKDSISVCKACEFRHMCTDARIPGQHTKSNQWYHTTECNYNPYIAKWKGERGYVSLAASGVTVKRKGIFINRDLLFRTLEDIYVKQVYAG